MGRPLDNYNLRNGQVKDKNFLFYKILLIASFRKLTSKDDW